MTHASLFSGIGGFDLAASWMGWENAFLCEVNPFCRKILKYYFKKSKLYGDIKETDFRQWRGRVDVLTAGFPCQPFSQAGKRKGSADDRYLWPEVIRVIQEVRPTWFIGENVAGITSMVFPCDEIEVESGKTLFGEDYRKTVLQQQSVVEFICNDLEQAGYTVQPLLIPACAVGAPHRRDRIWFAAHRADAGHEGMQQAGENGVYEPPTVAHPNSDDATRYGHAETGGENGKNESKGTVSCNGFSFDLSDKGIISDANIERSSGRNSNIKKNFKTSGVAETSRLRCIGIFTHSSGRRNKNDKGQSSGQPEQNIPDWRNFPTQSPVCGRNDGISQKLDGITFCSWRRQSIEAFGNAIVPQVACKIFKTIDSIAKQNFLFNKHNNHETEH